MKKALLATLSASAGALLFMPLAHADLLATYSINGGPTTTLCTAASGSSCSKSGTADGVTAQVFAAGSNSPGTPTLAELLSSTLSVTNNGTNSVSIVVNISDDGFTQPTTPPDLNLFSNIGGTSVIGGKLNSLSFVSSIEPDGYATAALTPDITGSNSSFQATDFATISSLSAPFSIAEQYNITLTAGSQINFSAHSDLSPVPEPGSLLLFGSALVGIGTLVGWKRRKHLS